eukprot:3669752-Pleurochrysis_carterae.AAC.2
MIGARPDYKRGDRKVYGKERGQQCNTRSSSECSPIPPPVCRPASSPLLAVGWHCLVTLPRTPPHPPFIYASPCFAWK